MMGHSRTCEAKQQFVSSTLRSGLPAQARRSSGGIFFRIGGTYADQSIRIRAYRAHDVYNKGLLE